MICIVYLGVGYRMRVKGVVGRPYQIISKLKIDKIGNSRLQGLTFNESG